jgi:hypothetical protein
MRETGTGQQVAQLNDRYMMMTMMIILTFWPILDKLLEYKRNWIHVNRMPRNRLPRVIKHYSPTGRKNHGRALKRLLDA